MFDIFGIYGQRWQRIASRFPRILSLEQRSEGRRLYSYVHREKKILVKIQEEVIAHRVTKALQEIHKWEGYIRKGTKKGVKLAESQVFQYFHILKATKHFTSALDKFAEHVNRRPKGNTFRARADVLIREAATKMYRAIQAAENEGGRDMKTLMAYMNEELDKKPGDFIANVVTAMKRSGDISILSKLSLRIDIKKELRDLKSLEKLAKELEALDRKLEKNSSKEDYNQALGKFEALVFMGEHNFEEMFRVAHLVMKRDLLLLIMVASDERIMHQLGLDWVHKHFLPESPFQKTDIEINELNKKLSEKAHTIANGLNVIVKGMDKIRKELELEIAKSS